MSFNKLSVAESDSDHLITCSCNGDTLIMDQNGEVATFKLGESVTAFCTGAYTVKANTKPVSCFVFRTSSRKVYLLFNMFYLNF